LDDDPEAAEVPALVVFPATSTVSRPQMCRSTTSGYRGRQEDLLANTGALEIALLDGRYALEDVIGRGGMADVYLGRDEALRRPVAVKILREITSDPHARARFTAEARTLAGLSHPGLVAVLDAGTDGERPYLVMELIRGTTLRERCGVGPLDPTQAMAVGTQLADALAYVHSHGIVHRDVKPGNVLLSGDGRILLTDFGIARLTSEPADLTGALTMGTAAYLAPEQLRRDPLGPAVDVYALGLLLLEALTGERAYPGPPTEAMLARLTSSPAIPGRVPPPWRALLRAMTAGEPADRPTMVDVGSTLAGLAEGGGPEPTGTADSATEPLSAPISSARPFLTSSSGQHVAARARTWGGVPHSWWARLSSGYGGLIVGLCLGAVLLFALIPTLLVVGGDRAGSSDIPSSVPSRTARDLQTPTPTPVASAASPADNGGQGDRKGGGKDKGSEGHGKGDEGHGKGNGSNHGRNG
jgi:serine/threonine protein kinase